MIGKEKSTQDPGSKNRNPGHPPHYCGLAQQLRPGFRSIPGPPARWSSPDPSGITSASLTDPQMLNRYAYARNTPLDLVDPTGLGPKHNAPQPSIGRGDPSLVVCSLGGFCGDEFDWVAAGGLGYVVGPSSGSTGQGDPSNGASGCNAKDPSCGGGGTNCGMCVYLNDEGTGISPDEGNSGGGIDPNSNPDECKTTGGVFVDESASGPLGGVQIYTNPENDYVAVVAFGDNYPASAVGIPGQYTELPTQSGYVMATDVANMPGFVKGYDASTQFAVCMQNALWAYVTFTTGPAGGDCLFNTPGLISINPTDPLPHK